MKFLRRNEAQPNDIQHNNKEQDTKHNDIQQPLDVMLGVVMLSVSLLCYYAEGYRAECRYPVLMSVVVPFQGMTHCNNYVKILIDKIMIFSMSLDAGCCYAECFISLLLC